MTDPSHSTGVRAAFPRRRPRQPAFCTRLHASSEEAGSRRALSGW